MLDIGWPELMLIAVATIIVVGPRELPRVLRTVNGYVRKARSLASEFQNSVEDMAREADLDDLKKQWKETGGDFSGDLEKSMDPTGEVSSSMRDIKDTMNARYTDGSSSAPGNSVVPPAEEPGEGTTDEGEPGPLPPKQAESRASASDSGAAKKGVAKKASAKKTSAKKASTKKASTKKASAKKASAKKAGGKDAPAKAGAAKKSSAKKSSAKTGAKTGAKKAGAKKATAKKSAAKSAAPADGTPSAPASGGGSGAG